MIKNKTQAVPSNREYSLLLFITDFLCAVYPIAPLNQYTVAVVDLVLNDLRGESRVACRFPREAVVLKLHADGLVASGRSRPSEQGERRRDNLNRIKSSCKSTIDMVR